MKLLIKWLIYAENEIYNKKQQQKSKKSTKKQAIRATHR